MVDVFASLRAQGIGSQQLSTQDAKTWLQEISADTAQFEFSHDFETQSQANEFVLKLYEIILEYTATFDAWIANSNYDSIQHAIEISEI